MPTYWIPVFLVILTTVTATGRTPVPSLTVLYNSRASDGPFQLALLKGVGLGLRDATGTDSTTPQPLFLDLSDSDLNMSVDWIIQNGTHTLISLLSSNQLKSFCHLIASHKLKERMDIFTSRDLPDESTSFNGSIRVTSLQMSLESRIMALLHRIMKVGTRTLLPVLDDQTQLPLLRKYKESSSKLLPELQFLSPIFMSQTASWISHPSFSFETGNGTGGHGQGILLLSANGLSEDAKRRFVDQDHFFRWFSHDAFHEIGNSDGSPHEMFGLYSVQYVGSGNWDNSLRRRLLKEFNSFTGNEKKFGFCSFMTFSVVKLKQSRHFYLLLTCAMRERV